MNKAYLYVLAFLLGGLVLFFWMKGCGPASGTDKIQDSLRIEQALNDTIAENARFLMSYSRGLETKNARDSASYRKTIDSQSRVIAALQGKFRVTKDSIGTLYDQLKVFYDSHDTIDLANAYAELHGQLDLANQLLFSIQIGRDSADNINTAEIGRLRVLVTALQSHIKAYEALLVECTTNASNLAKTGQKAARQAKMNALFAKIGAGLAVLVTLLLIGK